MPNCALIISPRLAIQKGDFLGSGVPYWPLEAAIFAAYLCEKTWKVDFLDLFGMDPAYLSPEKALYWQGIPLERALEMRSVHPKEYDLIFVYALSAMSHRELLEIVESLKRQASTPVIIFENSQAVTGYDLLKTKDSFAAAGADWLLIGEPYGNGEELLAFLSKRERAKPLNLCDPKMEVSDARRFFMNDAHTPIPAWDLIPYQNYWKLPYGHGPKSGPYFPILTSRGCPYPCTFCVVPSTNNQRWRPRPAEEVVEEMISLSKRYGAREFHWEDLNPTIDRLRMAKISKLLVDQGSPIRFRLVSGTKVETLDLSTLGWMAKGGCDYISLSPESGSPEILRKMRKPFDHEQGLEMVKAMTRHGISSQACFVLGHPEESPADRTATERYVRRLVQAGIGEAAFFILSTLPGSTLSIASEANEMDELWSFSPRHRPDYANLQRWRQRLIRKFLLWKLMFQPFFFFQQCLRALSGAPRLKMEMLPRRVCYVLSAILRRSWKSAFQS